MKKALKRSPPKEQKQLQLTVKFSQAFLRSHHPSHLGRPQRAVSETQRLCRVLLRKSREIRTSRSSRYLRQTTLALLRRARHRHHRCRKRSHSLHRLKRARNSHRLILSIVLLNRKLRNRSPLHIPVRNLVGDPRKMSGLLPNQTRRNRATMKETLPLEARLNIWHQSCSVPWLHLVHCPRWIASRRRRCRTAHQCRALSNSIQKARLPPHLLCLSLAHRLPHRHHLQCPDLQLRLHLQCRIALRLADRQREQPVEEVLHQ